MPVDAAKHFSVEWLDGHKQPRCQPDPAYPDGKDVDASFGAARTCRVDLPCPAKRIGLYSVRCLICGSSAGVTTAGRSDDPRSVKIACKIGGSA